VPSVLTNNVAVPAAEQQTGHGIPPLSAAMRGAGGVCLPGAWHVGAAGVKGPRRLSRKAAEFARVRALAAVTKPGNTNIRKQYVHMTRVDAEGDGASGSHSLREPA
jgi:hypothetical protein